MDSMPFTIIEAGRALLRLWHPHCTKLVGATQLTLPDIAVGIRNKERVCFPRRRFDDSPRLLPGLG